MTNSKDFSVTTVSGKTIPRNKCRYIKAEYYEINVDCFLMPDGRWHRINNGQIAFDHEQQKYVLIEQTKLKEGIVGINDDRSFKFGLFSPNPIKNIEVNDIPCISEDVVSGLDLRESVLTGGLYTKEYYRPAMATKGIKSKYSFDLDYSASPKIKMFTSAYNENFKYSGKMEIPDHFVAQLGSTTWGCECETSNGKIPERLLFKNGLIPLRDGSLRHDGIEPFEYTTIPLSGKKGIQTMVDISGLLNKYTEISHMCAFHLHIGGYKPTKELLLALHRIMIKVQDEVYSMFPENYKYTSENGFKQKDYCAPITNIRLLKGNTVDQNFNVLFNHYAGCDARFVDFGYSNHPKDEGNRQKWQISERYKLMNCIPMIWGGSSTCEWRVHPPTQNIHLMLNWLFICNAIMKYADKNQTEIANFGELKNVTLESIISDVYSSDLAAILNKYIEWKRLNTQSDDRIGSIALMNDAIDPPYSVLK